MDKNDEELIDGVALSKLKKIADEISLEGFNSTIKYQRENNEKIPEDFLQMLEQSEFFKELFREGVVWGMMKFSEARQKIRILK